MPKFRTIVSRFNERVAVLGTRWFSSMWTFYVFFFLGLSVVLPILPDGAKAVILLTSSAWLQLFSLPLLSVGNSVMNKASERRAKQDHEILQKQVDEIRIIQEAAHRDMIANVEMNHKLDTILESINDKKD